MPDQHPKYQSMDAAGQREMLGVTGKGVQLSNPISHTMFPLQYDQFLPKYKQWLSHNLINYSEVTWMFWCLKWPMNWLLVQDNNKENIEYYWYLPRRVHQRIPFINVQQCRKSSCARESYGVSFLSSYMIYMLDTLAPSLIIMVAPVLQKA